MGSARHAEEGPRAETATQPSAQTDAPFLDAGAPGPMVRDGYSTRASPHRMSRNGFAVPHGFLNIRRERLRLRLRVPNQMDR